ncbi:condensation domain-containing protein [Yinghuangia soli]|uniref:Condensation domain-containing protein n=1 Tax=Yinghuangia soli TaxID=2908204 RepID=A0AA41PW45_9ACTN|nr:condensation domain-containing protein [Yinghuangia soli]MCF2526702.1 condensation domain-containing protein [Yinghuangia soli]
MLHLIEQGFPSTGFTIPFAFRVTGALDTGVLREAVALLARRHEALRTRVVDTEQGPRAIADAEPQEMVTIAAGDPDELLEAQFSRSFAAATEHPLRVLVVPAGDGEWVVGIHLHHLSGDAWTLGVLMRDLGHFYGELAAGRSPEAEDGRLQQIDFAAWERDAVAQNVFTEEIAYWKEQLAGSAGMPLDAHSPSYSGICQPSVVGYLRVPLTDDLAAFCARERVTPYPVVFAAMAAVLCGETGRTDLSVTSAMDNRMYPGVEETAGYFANTVFLRAQLDEAMREGSAGFDVLLKQAAEACSGAFAHQQVPYLDLMAHAETGLGVGRPVILFQYFSQEFGAPELAGCRTEALVDDAARRRLLTSPSGLRVVVSRRGAGFCAEFVWQPELWSEEYIGAMADRFGAAVRAACADRHVPLRDLIGGEQAR